MRRPILLFFFVAMALAAFGAASADTIGRATKDNPILPRGRKAIRFDHRIHAQKGAACPACHAGAISSRSASDVLAPSGVACDGCHGTGHSDPSNVTAGTSEIGRCSFCHDEPDRPWPSRNNLRFSHQAHARRNIGCAQCHDDVEDKPERTIGKSLPDMRRCLSCHGMDGAARGDAKSGCPVCHLTDLNGLLVTRFSIRTASGSVTERTLVPPPWQNDAAHGPDFISRHKRIAGDNSVFCASCHAERFCTDCHDGRVRPRDVHPGDFISMHPIAARKNVPVCSSCHAAQSFCLDCHAWAGVSEVGASSRGRRFHPPDWSGLGTTRGPGHHAWEAQRNLTACVSCHTERDCALCHASTARRGLGINPHPTGFASGCRAQLARNRRPCLVCHDAGSGELNRCN